MKKLFFFITLMFVVSLPVFALTASEAGQFEKANLAYRAGQFDEASALYKALSEKFPQNPVFQFNYGNALHRKGEVGTSILALERARLAAPRNADILYNLNFLRNLPEYKIEDKRNEGVKLAEKILSYFTFEELLVAALFLSLLFLASWAWVLFFKEDSSWGFLRKTLLCLVLVFAAAVVIKGIQLFFFREAIVIVKQAQVYYGPSVTDQQAFRLGDGLKTYVVDEREGWSRILIASGESGWIQKDQIAEVRPRSV